MDAAIPLASVVIACINLGYVMVVTCNDCYPKWGIYKWLENRVATLASHIFVEQSFFWSNVTIILAAIRRLHFSRSYSVAINTVFIRHAK